MENFASPQPQEWPPDLPGFDPVRCLGRGSQGQVWLMSPHDGSPAVAAKFLAQGAGHALGAGAEDPARHNESRITREWRLLAQLRHEHLIPVHRLVADGSGSLVLIMEYAAGGSLGQIVRARGPLSVGEAVTILTPMGQVLAFLHGRGAVHGDVSGGNILLSASGKPFLADFGFSRVLGQAPGQPAGTPGFYCPSDPLRNEATDVYALAAVGWFALTGSAPPPTRARPPLTSLLPDVPRELVAALEAGLQENPVHRPAAAAMAQAVFRSARAEPVILANAVHPSVLPELPTRRAARDKRPRWNGKLGGSRRRAGKLGGSRPRALVRRSVDQDGVEALRPAGWSWRHRKVKSLAPLWRSVEQPTAAGRHGADRHDGAAHRLSGRVRGRAAVWFMGILGLGAAMLGVAVLSGAWPGLPGEAGDVGHGNNAGTSAGMPEASPAALAGQAAAPLWATALPEKIQQGIVAEAPEEALGALAWTRSFALSNADQQLLHHINAADSPAWEADNAMVAKLKDSGHGFTGLEFTVEKIHGTIIPAPVPGGDVDGRRTVTVHATILTGPFAEQDAAGVLVHNHPKVQRQELGFVLTRVDGRWVIQQIMEAASLPAS